MPNVAKLHHPPPLPKTNPFRVSPIILHSRFGNRLLKSKSWFILHWRKKKKNVQSRDQTSKPASNDEHFDLNVVGQGRESAKGSRQRQDGGRSNLEHIPRSLRADNFPASTRGENGANELDVRGTPPGFIGGYMCRPTREHKAKTASRAYHVFDKMVNAHCVQDHRTNANQWLIGQI